MHSEGGGGVTRGVGAGRGGGLRGGGEGRGGITNRRPRIDRTAENRVKNNFARSKNIVIGKKPSSGAMTWGGANLTVTAYIGRVGLDVTSDDIKTDLTSRGVNVLELQENATRHSLFKSFKLIVPKKDYNFLIEDDIGWPDGVIFRRFYQPRSDRVEGTVSA